MDDIHTHQLFTSVPPVVSSLCSTPPTTTMDLLCSAYADEDEEEEVEHHPNPSPFQFPLPSKRKQRSHEEEEVYSQHHHHDSSSPSVIPTQGRYVSKRERAVLSFSSSSSSSPSPTPIPPPPPPSSPSPVVGSLAAPSRCQTKAAAAASKVSGKRSVVLTGHTNAVNSIQWSLTHAHLLASAGMDQTVHVWNVWNQGQEKARVFRNHNAAIKDVRWSPRGLFLLSCGYDCSSRLVDVEKGTESNLFKEDQVVESVRFHPKDSNLFLSGGSKGFLRLWDTRTSKVAHQYLKGLGPILDIEFSVDGKHFLSSTDTSRSNISENSIIVWDVSRQIPLSNQVYVEAYTCPCVRYHPSDACFVAQSNGNYIAIFSARPPFKLDKYKRYEKHGVWGFPVKCNFSSDGKELASGSSDGCIYLYNYRSSELVRKIKAFEEACVDVAYHPLVPNVIAACSWTGEVSIFE
ncbi:WD repeat-containing protein 25 [Iris pallida]|uniref:WD repeat-containing protein 25 n=1 Tax=Iris pallida TaxID=29817 RepID=A0AAX6GNH3_IRIPA|nr:WD repeat-containing protein 25 [Iris pallida]